MKSKLTTILLLTTLITAACAGAPAAPTARSTTAPSAAHPTQAVTAPTQAPAAVGTSNGAKLIKIGIVQFVKVAQLDAAVQGVVDTLKENGYQGRQKHPNRSPDCCGRYGDTSPDRQEIQRR